MSGGSGETWKAADMPITKFTKWIGSPLDGLSLEDLMNDLSDLFLDSGFNFNPGRAGNSTMDMESLRQAIIEKLVEMGRIPESMLEEWLTDRESEESQKLDALVSEVIKRLVEEGWLKTENRKE